MLASGLGIGDNVTLELLITVAKAAPRAEAYVVIRTLRSGKSSMLFHEDGGRICKVFGS